MNVAEINRGSKYIGVSKNGKQGWQVWICVDKQKTYLATHQDQVKAAKIFDIALI